MQEQVDLVAALRAEVGKRYSFHNIVGRSPAMQDVFEIVRRVADTRTSVLLTGESGTGKGELARAIHALSPRAGEPFVGRAGQLLNLMLAATAMGLGVCPVGAFFDEEVEGLVGVDRQAEVALYLASVGPLA